MLVQLGALAEGIMAGREAAAGQAPAALSEAVQRTAAAWVGRAVRVAQGGMAAARGGRARRVRQGSARGISPCSEKTNGGGKSFGEHEKARVAILGL